jgi:hypothetical protein
MISVRYSDIHFSCIVVSYKFLNILNFFCDLPNNNFPIIVFQPVFLALPLIASRYPPCNIFFSKILNGPLFLNKRYKHHTVIQKAVTYYLNTYYRRTLSLRMGWILISLDNILFRCAVRVTVVQLSSV